jgi:hypothetical protein
MVKQIAMRPYATAGVALVGASVIAVTPLVTPPPASNLQTRQVQLVDAWSDLLTDTTANLDNIISNANQSDIAQVFSALLTNPAGVIQAFTNLDPTVTTDTSSLPITVGVQLPPGLEVLIAQLGAEAASFQAISGVAAQLSADPSNALSILYEGLGSVLNAGLNGADNVSILDGIITIPLFNGILAPLQTMNVDLNLIDLLNALGLGTLSLSNLDLSGLLSQLGLGDLTLGGLFSDLGISGDGLGTLLGDPSLSTLLGDLGLGNLGLGNLGLTDVLNDLGLNTTLNDLSLSTVLSAFGINSPLSDLSGLSLSSILSSFGVDLPSGATLGGTTLTSLLSDLGLGSDTLTTLLQNAATHLGGTTATLIGTLLAVPGVETILNQLNLGELVSGLTLGNGGSLNLDTLLGDLGVNLPSSADLANIDISDVLTSLGVAAPGSLSIGTILTDLGAAPTTGDLTLGGLLGDLGAGDLSVGTLLNSVNLGDLLGDLGLSNLPLNLSDLGNLGDLGNLNLDGLLTDLGLGNIADISVSNFGGLITELADVIPQQILASI